MEKKRMTQLYYDRDSDVLYLSIGEPRPAVSQEVGDDVLLRVDADTGEIVGLTILNLSTRAAAEVLPVTIELHELMR